MYKLRLEHKRISHPPTLSVFQLFHVPMEANPWRRRFRRFRNFAESAVRVTGRPVVNAVQDAAEIVFTNTPDIIWDMDAEQRGDIARWGGYVGAAFTGAGLVVDGQSETSLGKRKRTPLIRGSNQAGSSGLVHPTPPPSSRSPPAHLRDPRFQGDWLRLSESQPSTQTRREQVIGPWIARKKKVLSWFRTRLLLRARAKKRRRRSRPYRARQGLITFSRYVDNLQRRYRRVNRYNTAFGRHLLQKLARAKRYLWKKRRAYRRHGFLPSIP